MLQATQEVIDSLKCEVEGLDFQSLNNLKPEVSPRLTKFTASENHRLMAGVDITEAEKLKKAAKGWGNKADLVKKAKSIGCIISGKETIPELMEIIMDCLPDEERDEILADRLPDGAITYVEEKVIEHKTGKPLNNIETFDMMRGKELEPEAVAAFEEATGLKVTDSVNDQIFHDLVIEGLENEAGATPDGRVEIGGKTYGFETKAPKANTHIKYLYGSDNGNIEPLTKDNLKTIEPNYYWQIVTGLLATGWDGWIFQSYHPDFKEDSEKRFHFIIEREDLKEEMVKMVKRLRMAVAKKSELLNRKR